MRGRRTILVTAIIAVAVLLQPAQAASAYGDRSQFAVWSLGGTVTRDESGCTITGAAGVQEIGKNHVTRLKVKFELRGANDTTSFLPTYRTSTYYNSPSFPDDRTSYHVVAQLPSGLFRIAYSATASYSLWAVGVGERSWRRDFKSRVLIGIVSCGDIPEDPGTPGPGISFSS